MVVFFPGQLWLHVSQPAGGAESALRTVTVGGESGTAVWAVDASGKLHRRQEVTHVFPEGSSWQQAATGVRSASATAGGRTGREGELWAVLESAVSQTLVGGIVTVLQTVGGVALDVAGAAAGAAAGTTGGDPEESGGVARGVLARRSGITPDTPLGTGWDIAIGVRNVGSKSISLS